MLGLTSAALIAWSAADRILHPIQRADAVSAGSKILYAHLGSAPALNGYGSTFRNA